ncbi:serine/threonine-protein kinase [Sorangium atrum]|uniref:Serine/threonine-protein kinase n=1 Tax=Sorangium atrum TaxID=2995308 RepID=A0ABT5BYM4_9BACT|nr:serine/threonine-protein kinase [Sorangium aterium]MDC0679211.1 serine/threonine-protein kinase [Sorangium aterium]
MVDSARAVAARSDRSGDAGPASSAAGRGDVAQDPRRNQLVAGRYKLSRLVGRGAMGEVWLAHDRALRIDVALKLLTVQRESQAGTALERFRFEAQVAAQLAQKTDHVVAVHDVGNDPAVGPYLVMGYVRGRSLRQLMQGRGPISPAEFAPLLGQMGEALSVAHGLGIVHRDIKPTNVLLEEERNGDVRAKVADFGIAKWIRKELPADFPRRTVDGVVLGTPAYLSPEHACDGDTNPHSDMWALAVVSYEALTGRLPFSGHTMSDVLASILATAQPPGPALYPEAPPALSAWFARAFALNPTERFPSIEAMVAAYKAAVGPSAAPARAERAEPARRGKLGLAAGLVVALGVVLSTGALWAQAQVPAALRASSVDVRAASVVRAARARIAAQASPRPAARSGDAAAVEAAVPAPDEAAVPAAAPRPLAAQAARPVDPRLAPRSARIPRGDRATGARSVPTERELLRTRH